MDNYIETRVIDITNFILKTETTIRQAAKKFKISKSTVYKDVTQRLKIINPKLAIEVSNILKINKSERHIRGGLATKEKFMIKRKPNNNKIFD